MVTFPRLVSESTLRNATLVPNGFYDKEAMSLKPAYQPISDNAHITSMDERLIFQDKEKYSGTGNVFHKYNLLYEANLNLLKEIEERENQESL